MLLEAQKVLSQTLYRQTPDMTKQRRLSDVELIVVHLTLFDILWYKHNVFLLIELALFADVLYLSRLYS